MTAVPGTPVPPATAPEPGTLPFPVHIATCPPGCTERHALTAPDEAAALLADVAEARDQLAAVQRGAGEWVREAVAREHNSLTGQLAAVTGERDRYAGELDEARNMYADARADLDGADAMIARAWPKCPDGCGCRLGDTGDGAGDADARECGCDGPCTMECRENGYPDAPSYRDLAVAAVTAERDKAYRERAALVAYLAACQPSAIVWGADPAAPGWPVIFAGTPAGQMSWHLAASDVALFGHVEQVAADSPGAPKWDGHSTPEKYQRLAALTAMVAGNLHDPLRVEAAAAHGRIGALTAQLAEVTRQNERNYTDAIRNAQQLSDVEASLGTARHVVRALLGAFVKTSSGWSARLSGTVLARAATQAGVDAPDGTSDGQAELPPKWAPADWKETLKRLHGLVREALCETEWDPGQIRQWLSDHGVPDLDDEAEDGADA